MEEDSAALVMDTGSFSIKAGFSGEDGPQATVRSLVGYSADSTPIIGSPAINQWGFASLMYPIQHGIVRNWALAELLWRHMFETELKINIEEHPVILSEPPLNPKMHREKTCQLFFESFEVPGLYMAPTSLLSLYGSARTSGLVIDLGEGVSHAVPISEGTMIPHAVGRLDVGGYDVTSNLLASIPQLVNESHIDREIARDIKETCCYIAPNSQKELDMLQANPERYQRNYTLPDGSSITLSKECFNCPEMLLDPAYGGRNAPRFAEVVYHSIRSCDPDLHRTMFNNIHLTGGSALFPGFPERCEREIRGMMAGNANVKVFHAAEARENAVWIGGCIVSALPTFQQMWVSKGDYEESGPTVIHRKCF